MDTDDNALPTDDLNAEEELDEAGLPEGEAEEEVESLDAKKDEEDEEFDEEELDPYGETDKL